MKYKVFAVFVLVVFICQVSSNEILSTKIKNSNEYGFGSKIYASVIFPREDNYPADAKQGEELWI